ncbi:hypothetical protein AB0L25_29920 [Spirillospora sp. NPDC052242]
MDEVEPWSTAVPSAANRPANATGSGRGGRRPDRLAVVFGALDGDERLGAQAEDDLAVAGGGPSVAGDVFADRFFTT